MMTEQEQKTFQKTAALLRDAGFTGISLNLARSQERETAVRDHRLERKQDSLDQVFVLSGTLGGRQGRISFTAMPKEDGAEALAAQLRETALLGTPGEAQAGKEQKFGGKGGDETGGNRPFYWEAHETVLPVLLKAAGRAYEFPETALVENLAYQQHEEQVFCYDDNGALVFSDSTGYHCLRMTVIAGNAGDRELANTCRYGKRLGDMDAMGLSEQTAREAIGGLSGRSLPSGSYRIVLQNAVAAELLEAFLPAFYGNRQSDGTSCLSGKVGQPVAADFISLREIPGLAEGRVSRSFDDEGTPVSETYLIKDGVLMAPLLNEKTAAAQGKESTGNGFRPDLQSDIETGVTNLRLEIQKDKGCGNLLEALGDGLLVTSVDGVFAGTNVKDGSFSLIAGGRIVENGRITGAFRQVTIAGNFFDMLREAEGADEGYAATTPDCACVLAPSLLAGSLVVSGT